MSYNFRHPKRHPKRKTISEEFQPKGNKQPKAAGQAQPIAMAPKKDVGMAEIYALLQNVEGRMANVEDNINDHKSQLATITGDLEDEVFGVSDDDDEEMGDLEDITPEAQGAQALPLPLPTRTSGPNQGARSKIKRVNNNNQFKSSTSRAQQIKTQAQAKRGGRSKSIGGRPPPQRDPANSGTPARPRRSVGNSTLSQAQRKEIFGIVNKSIMRSKIHQDIASTQILIHGTFHDGTEPFDTEAKTALDLLHTIYPHVSVDDIEQMHRFTRADDDGTYPLCVTFERRSVADVLIEKWRQDPGKFPWFQTSKSRDVRRWNAEETKEVERLNSNISDADPTIWELKVVGDMLTRRRVPNPNYKAPAIPEVTVAGQKTSSHNKQRSQQTQIHRNPNKGAK